MNRQLRGYQPPSVLDLLIGWAIGMVVTTTVVRMAITMIVPLLPWIVSTTLSIAALRLWLYRKSQWR